MGRSRYALVSALLLGGLARGMCAEDELLAEVRERFRAEQPSVRMHYNVSYRFLFLHIRRLATATARTTEGRWRDRSTGAWVPALMVEADLDTDHRSSSSQRGRVSICRQFVSVMTRPAMDTVLCIKRADEYINPLFRQVREANYVEVYDMEGGRVRYRREDFLAGTVETNPADTGVLDEPGRELAILLKRVSAVYHEKQPMLRYDSPFRLAVNIDGVSTPFSARSRFEPVPVEVLGAELQALRVDLKPAPEAEGRGRPLTMWAASLGDVAAHARGEALPEGARGTADWNMVPLVADYGLSIGYARVLLTGVGVGE